MFTNMTFSTIEGSSSSQPSTVPAGRDVNPKIPRATPIRAGAHVARLAVVPDEVVHSRGRGGVQVVRRERRQRLQPHPGWPDQERQTERIGLNGPRPTWLNQAGFSH